MIPALSVRIAEHPRRKDRTEVGLDELARLAVQHGFTALSLRASVVSVDSAPEVRRRVREVLDAHGLRVSMITGDLPLATNAPEATQALRRITPYLDLAAALGTDLVRVMVHGADDVAHLQRAADEAGERGMRLAQQCHWGSLAETVEQCVALMRATARDNVGLTFEPANLMACGGPWGADAAAALVPWLFNVYFQNLRLLDGAPVQFATRARGPVGVEFLPVDDPRGIDPAPIAAALREARYAGWFTVHQPCLPGQGVPQAVAAAGRLLSLLPAG